ncbi:MAG: hypothetical protein EAX96_21230, partial [Candidatus Lokiarchaeota archaeon]|nr:hypothetical protein [Candidatus Lokiarchaeota archaeon]
MKCLIKRRIWKSGRFETRRGIRRETLYKSFAFLITISLISSLYIVYPALAAETYGADSNPTGNPIGGGTGYSDIFTPDDPRVTYVVSDRAEFLNAIKNVKSGDVIYVEETSTIDLTGIYTGVTIPGGVTIASNRGFEGSPGGRIIQYRDGGEPSTGRHCALRTGGEHIRITGLRIEGPDKTDSITGRYKAGIVQNNLYLEVDNCEIYGWSHSGILQEGYDEKTYGAYIHHNYIHHCILYGFGYGISNGGTTLIEAN